VSKTKRLFISDIHLSSEEIYKNHPDISWFKPDRHKQRLLNFIDNTIIAKKNSVKDVILLGDIFNTWICPASIPPPSYQEIFNANQDILDKFQEIVENGINLFYMNGDHDFELMPAEIENRVFGIRAIRYYRTSRIHAEHGNRFDIFNKPDYITDPAYGTPVGYFIRRLIASAGGREIDILDLSGSIDDIIEAAVTEQNIFSSIIEGLAERINMGDADSILMPNGKQIAIGELKERYKKLSGVYNKRELIADLSQRMYLNESADHLCQKYDFNGDSDDVTVESKNGDHINHFKLAINIVVFGHTLNAMVDKDFYLVENRIYANTGSWCKDKAYCVEIDKSARTSGQVRVNLYSVTDDGALKKEASEKV
jgi:UDP-2,3-diacylglucosamine pyrophosphatase LpxH